MWVLKIKKTERKFTVAMGGEYSDKPSYGNLMTGLNFNLSCCLACRNKCLFKQNHLGCKYQNSLCTEMFKNFKENMFR